MGAVVGDSVGDGVISGGGGSTTLQVAGLQGPQIEGYSSPATRIHESVSSKSVLAITQSILSPHEKLPAIWLRTSSVQDSQPQLKASGAGAVTGGAVGLKEGE